MRRENGKESGVESVHRGKDDRTGRWMEWVSIGRWVAHQHPQTKATKATPAPTAKATETTDLRIEGEVKGAAALDAPVVAATI